MNVTACDAGTPETFRGFVSLGNLCRIIILHLNAIYFEIL